MLKRRAMAYAAIGCSVAGFFPLWVVTVSVAPADIPGTADTSGTRDFSGTLDTSGTMDTSGTADTAGTTEPGLPVVDEKLLPTGWSYQFTLDGALFWNNDVALLEAPGGASASPLWYDFAAEGFFLFEGDEVGRALVRLRDRHSIDIEPFLRWYPVLAAAVARADDEVLSGVRPDDVWGDWALASNAMMLPDHLAGQEPYPGWGEEFFGDFDGDGRVTVEDFERARTAGEQDEPVQVITWNGVRIIAPVETGEPAADKPAPTAPILPDAGIIISSILSECMFRSVYTGPDCFWLPWPRDPIDEDGSACCGSGEGGTPSCWGRCCFGSYSCCGSPDPCCDPGSCCGNPDRCCYADNPCCGNPDPCCYSNDPCCGNPNRCCNPDNPCCGSPNPCCQVNDPCCGNPDPCCNPDNPCCGSSDPCCFSSDPSCCDSGDPCCDIGDACCYRSGPPAQGPRGCAYLPDECNDFNDCTDDACINRRCRNEPLTGTPCQDDGNPCTQDYCVEGECIHPCENCASCDFGLCVDGTCRAIVSTYQIETGGVLCPGETIELEVTGSCWPDCGVLSIGVEEPPEHGAVWGGGGIDCDGDNDTVTIYVRADPDAPPGVMTFQLRALRTMGGPPPVIRTGSVTVTERVDLSFAGTPDDDETDPGGFIVLNDDDDNGNGVPDMEDGGGWWDADVRSLTISADASLTGNVRLSFVRGSEKVKVYENSTRTGEIILPQTWAISSLPKTIYFEGVVVSGSHADVEFELRHTGVPGAVCKDLLNLTVVDMELKTVGFDSARDPMLDNTTDYEPTGSPFGEPEWEPDWTPPRNAPFSHTMDSNVTVSVLISVVPVDLPTFNYELTCTGPPGLNYTGPAGSNYETVLLDGGINLPTLTSSDLLESKIQKLSATLNWEVRRDGLTYFRQETGPHTAYITMGPPRDTGDPRYTVTQNRMERAVAQAGAANSLNPHTIVKTVIQAQGDFDLTADRTNAWLVPDLGGDCPAIVRFAEKVAKMVDIPGTFEHKNIYAIETAPSVGVEVPGTHAGLNACTPDDPPPCIGDPRFHPTQPWQLFLIDGDGGCNAFEAAAKFTACSATRYYAGGVPGAVMANKDDVLKVFDTLSWVESVGGICTVREQVFVYPAVPPSPPTPGCP